MQADVPLLNPTACGAAELREVVRTDDVRPQAKRAIVQRLRDGGVDFWPQRPHLRRQVEVWNAFIHASVLGSMKRTAKAMAGTVWCIPELPVTPAFGGGKLRSPRTSRFTR